LFCKACKYELRGAASRRCPECGRPFDPADPRTFHRHRDEPLRGAVAVMTQIIGIVGATAAGVIALVIAIVVIWRLVVVLRWLASGGDSP
jgi:hypothetical protein